SPFIVTALAPLLLGETVGRYRWCAVVVGFLGALIVVRPGITGTNEAAFLIFGSALASALYQILSRKLAAHDEAETSITYIAVTTQAPTFCDGMAYRALAIFSRTGRRAWCWRVPGRTRPGRTLRRSVRRVRGGWDWRGWQ